RARRRGGAACRGRGGLPLRRRCGNARVGWLACGTVAASFVLAVAAFLQLTTLDPEHRLLLARLFPWIHVGSLEVDVAFAVDPLSAVMILVVTGIGGALPPFPPRVIPHHPAGWGVFSHPDPLPFPLPSLAPSATPPPPFLSP